MADLHQAITISKQMGSGGTYIGYLAARTLGFRHVDREILRKASRCLGVACETLEPLEERSTGLVEKIMKAFCIGAPEAAYMPPATPPLYDRELFALESRIMNQIADSCDAVIVGRGGFHALKNRPGVLHVFIHAPLDFRVRRLMSVQKDADYERVKSVIVDSDRKRGKFMKDIVGMEWTDATHYHLCIDASTLPFSAAVEMIRTHLVARTRDKVNHAVPNG